MALMVALDLELFEFIRKPTSLDEIVQKTSADPMILMRLLRVLSAASFLNETARNTWGPNAISQTLTIPAFRDWMKTHYHHLSFSSIFPQWLAKRQYKDAGSIDDCATSEVLGMPYWEWLDKNPKESALFDSAMSIQSFFPPEMRPPYPFNSQLQQIRTDNDAVTLVDIGGGQGHAIQLLRDQYPDVKGRWILQDLPKTIETIDPAHAKQVGFEPTVHDFFEPQPVKGAKYYHLRRVLHDWDDSSCIKILRHTYEAMKDTADYSRLLIHETVLPDVGSGLMDVLVDMTLMIGCGGMERTESHWYELLGKCGFTIVKLWRAEAININVIEAVVS